MKIKIFNVIRTQLYNDTLVWSFPTFTQAQEVMFAEVASEIKIDKDRLASKDGHFIFNGYDVWKGNDYITISDGNKVEYEIKQTSMDTYQMQVERIIDKVMMFSGACEEYRELIKYQLLCYTENDLPFYDDEIEHFVDTELRERFSKRAAAKIVSGYDNDFQDKYFKVVEDYLWGNRGISVMLAVINGEEDAIEDVKGEINREQGKVVFNLDYVYVATSVWQDGTKFGLENDTSVYKSHAAAAAAMKKKYEEAVEAFNSQYVGENVTYRCADDVYQVSFVDSYRIDVWEGRIEKIYVQD